MQTPFLIGIDGIDGAGKTTFANLIEKEFQAKGDHTVRVSIDSFHHPREVRLKQGTLSAKGYYEDSFDYSFLIEHLLKPAKALTQNQILPVSKFDWIKNSADGQREMITPNTFIVFDGIFLFRPELQDFWDFKIFLDIPFETSLARGLKRDSDLLGGVDATREKYLSRYIPGQKIYLEKVNPKSLADLVIKNS
ncbi:MAG: hypothetical protein NXH75_14965 [Halobacteriovoraceae bacterium]|nr:hypothetical protein [Halobacteriovoraceae bacterium]